MYALLVIPPSFRSRVRNRRSHVRLLQSITGITRVPHATNLVSQLCTVHVEEYVDQIPRRFDATLTETALISGRTPWESGPTSHDSFEGNTTVSLVSNCFSNALEKLVGSGSLHSMGTRISRLGEVARYIIQLVIYSTTRVIVASNGTLEDASREESVQVGAEVDNQ